MGEDLLHEEYIIKCRGLPWATTPKDMVTFFNDCTIAGGEEGIHLTLDKEGRASGDCFVELASEADVEKAKAHDKEHIGARYVEIHDAQRTEMEWYMNRMPGSGPNRMGGGADNDGFVRLRGLPFEASKQDIAVFFSGLEIAPYGITITMDQDGRPSGEAYVEFTSAEHAEKAVKKNKEKIGHRYIEIFNSSKYDVKYVTQINSLRGGGGGGFPARSMGGGRPGPYDRPSTHGGLNTLGPSGFNTGGYGRTRGGRGGGRGGGMGGRGMMGESRPLQSSNSSTGHMVHMRGLPFEATQGDVFTFFAPLSPAEVRILYEEEGGRPSGECDVDFKSHSDAEAAMGKNKENMGHRYIELFLRSTENSNNWSNSTPMLPPQMNNGMMNSGMQSGGYGGGYGDAGGYGGGGGYGSGYGSGDYGSGGGGGGAAGGNYGNYNSNGYAAGGYGAGAGAGAGAGSGSGAANSGYTSFNDKTNYSNIPQATGGGNYYNNSY